MFNQEKQRKANGIISRHLKNGEIARPEFCSKCPNKKHIQAHHPNYDLPDYIIWLCRKCHIKAHEEDAKEDRKRRKRILREKLSAI